MTDATPKKLHIKTYGCQMNVYDSERMAGLLAPLGYALTDAVDDADMVLLNTCTSAKRRRKRSIRNSAASTR